jgi:hypothetical protein
MIKQQSSTPTIPPPVPDLSAIISNASFASLAAETLASKSSPNSWETAESPATPLSLSLREALALRVLEKLAKVNELPVHGKRGKERRRRSAIVNGKGVGEPGEGRVREAREARGAQVECHFVGI